MHLLRLIPLLVLLTSGLAGCFGSEVMPAERTVSASAGTVSAGWDYAGETVAAGAASLSGTVNAPDDTGRLDIAFDWAGSRWTVTFDEFAAGQAFHDGGIVFDLEEHGDAELGSPDIPKVFARVAAWGTAAVARDGIPVTSFDGANARWAAHIMVSDTTVRGADGRILKADGNTPYDPAAPGDAQRVEGDPQAMLALVHPDGAEAAREPVATTQAFEFTGPESTQTVEVAAAPGVQSVVLQVNASAGARPVGAGELDVRVLDADGNVLDEQSAQVLPNQPAALTFELGPDQVAGPVTVELTGQGAFGGSVDSLVSYDDHPMIVVTWDEFTME